MHLHIANIVCTVIGHLYSADQVARNMLWYVHSGVTMDKAAAWNF